MKKVGLFCLIYLVLNNLAFSQTKEMPWQVGVGIGISEYSGDLGNGFFKFDLTSHNITSNAGKSEKNSPGIVSVSLSRYLNKDFDLALRAFAGEWGHFKNSNESFYRSTFGLEFTPRWKFLNKENARFTPYLTAGLGFRRINMPFEDYGILDLDKKGLYEFTIPAGLGLNIKITENIGVNIQTNYLWTSNDKSEMKPKLEEFTVDQAWLHTIGLTYNLGKVIDTDGDGVSDKKDKCPNTPAGDLVNPTTGCSIDTDKDGIADNKDKCPLVAGVANFGGCPDKDNDGVQDSDDKCPEVAGIANFNGCPDTDKDGIQDSEDTCPNEAGIIKFNGCPDSDGDGIKDSEDACPQIAGTTKFNGCADTDGDGIEDKLDNCPKVAGTATNNGCPEIKAAVKQLFEKALTGVQFETGKSVIKPSSFAILNNVVKILQENPTYKLYVSGHTDNAGKAASNLKLSQDRAAAVEKYLESKGINTNRVRSEGFGDTKPAHDNATKEGRDKNRRVEFKVEFEQ